MKKLLLASTALVGFAGAAAAEITLDGYAEIGVNGGDGGYQTQFHNDFQVNFNFSGTTDGGLEFGGKVQIEENNGTGAINGNGVSSNGPRWDDENFWVSGSFGKVTLGETAGAVDWAVPEVWSGTAISDDHSTHAGVYWNTALDGLYDDQIARYEYSFGDFGAAFSVEMDDTGVQDPVWAIGGKWSGDVGGTEVNAGIGYASNGDASTWSLAGRASMANGFSAALGFASFDHGTTTVFTDYVGNGVQVDSWWGLGLAYTTGALTVGVNYGQYEATTAGVTDPSGWGLVANYDLGGGAVAMFGYGSSNSTYQNGNGHGQDTWSMGLGMSF
jgi:outer membrane protein OmpU